MQILQLKDGRKLAYDVYGDPKGTPVIFNHGFSDSRLIRNPDNNLTASLGVRVIAADQPGVGGSSPFRGRKMVDWGKDMEALADFLQIDRFSVIGHSGGGPHALSIAYRLPERVTKIVLASPVIPLDETGMPALLKNKDLKLIARLHKFPFLIKWICNFSARSAIRNINRFMLMCARDDPSDAATLLQDPKRKAMFEASFTAGMVQGGEGLYEMIMALWDWGFELRNIKTPVKIFYGDTDQIIDVKMPQKLNDKLPNSSIHTWPGAGHYGFVRRDCWEELLKACV